jgi:DNA polymerase-1
MAAPRKVVLVDGSSLIFRAYFAIPGNLATATGLHTNAAFGFATMFRKMFAGRKPDLGAVVFDSPKKTFREERYPSYKAHRPALPDELAEQLEWIDKLVVANHFPKLRVEGYEADDVIGTLVKQAEAAGMDVLIVSADKDFAQLITDRVKMVDTLRDITYDPALVKKKWGVEPAQIVDLLALMGDQSDGIPGVRGVGQKGAAQLLEKYGSLAEIYAHLGELKGRQKTALEEHRDDAMLSRELATIDVAVPLDVGVEGLAIPAPDPSALNALYKELQFYSLLSEEARSEVEKTGAPVTYTTCRTREEVEQMIAALPRDAETPVAVLPLFDGMSPVYGPLAGLAFSVKVGEAWWLPFAGLGERPSVDDALAAVKPWLEDPSAPKLAHNAKELWIALTRHGVALEGVVADTMIASYLIDPTKLIPHRLEQLVKEYLQRTITPLKRVVGAGQKQRSLAELPVADVGAYACHLADAIVSLWGEPGRVRARLKETPSEGELARLELPLSWVLGRMELDGVRVDPKELAAIGRELAARLAEYEREIHSLAGHEFNIGSTKQLAAVLFEELKLPVYKRTKTGYSTDSDVLERLAPKHAIAHVILEHRKLAKLINTYTDVLARAAHPVTHRVHAIFQQATSATGRIISTEPDLQRTPVKTPDGQRIREAFIAGDGCAMISADWSQIELRLLAHLSRDENLVAAFRNGEDVHRRTAGELFGVKPADVTDEQRRAGKTVNFATIYGQGATALGQILGIPRADAQRYIDGYFAAYAGVREWLDETIAAAHRDGYVTTIFGRRRYIPELSSNNEMDRQTGERMATNTPIQGSAADLCKQAMLDISRRLRDAGMIERVRMLMQIHDELVFEAELPVVEQASAIIRDVMEHVVPLEVPLVVDLGTGRSWGEC